MRYRITGLCMLLLISVFAGRQAQAHAIVDQGAGEVLSDAQAAWDRGIALEDVDPGAATIAFSESADGWKRLIESGVDNGMLWLNLGNAEFHAGRTGEAIAAYLEADRLMPGNARVRANLLHARSQVPAKFDPADVTVLYDTVSDGWHVLGFDVRWWIASIAWIGFWGFFSWRLMRPHETNEDHEGSRLFARSALVGLGAVALVAGTTIALDIVEDAWRSPGVLLESTVVRAGNGETFPEVFSDALPEGVEFELIDTRPGWHHIQFADGRTGWVRSDHVRLINS